MKKKLIIALVLVLLLTFSLGALVGCDEIFEKDEQRDANQIVATVRYGNQVAHVTKGELAASFNSYAYAYVNYYGMTYQQTAEYLVKSLAQRELLVLFAKEYVLADYAKNGKIIASAPELLSNVDQLLTRSEKSKAIESVNEDLLSSLGAQIDGLYTDDKNNAATADGDEKNDTEITDAVKVRFNANGGSDVETQKIQKGTSVDEPKAPTYAGHAFYGWYTKDGSIDGNWGDKFDFDGKVESSITLYAKWAEQRAPRATMPKEEEEDDYDADNDDESVVIKDKFFDDAYVAKIKSKEVEVKTEVKIDSAEEWGKYVDRGIAKIKTNLASNYRDYDYYYESECKTILLEKLERLIGKEVEVKAEEIEARWQKLVADNKETFGADAKTFASALTKSLATTYYHKVTVDENNSGYGFVVNILLKMSEEDTKALTTLVSEGNLPKENVLELRDAKLDAMIVHVSNPDYDADAEIDYNLDGKVDAADREIADSIVDPMTDTQNNPFLIGNANYNDKYAKDNDYAKLITFGKDADGNWAITYNAHECPSMPYLTSPVSAQSVISQIYASFEEVKSYVGEGEGKMSYVEGIYWLNKVATAWVYLVGDDTGMTSTESNNGGLGYLITPDGEESGYLDGFTTLARNLIKEGAGAYTTDGTADRDSFYVYADSFIENGNVGNAYAGIFILLCSYKAWDTNAYKAYTGKDLTAEADGTGVLPEDYIVKYGKTADDCITIKEQVGTDLENGMKADLYSKKTNEFGLEWSKQIEYFAKVYESIWKDRG